MRQSAPSGGTEVAGGVEHVGASGVSGPAVGMLSDCAETRAESRACHLARRERRLREGGDDPPSCSWWGGDLGSPIPSPGASHLSTRSCWAPTPVVTKQGAPERHLPSAGSQRGYLKGLQVSPKERDEASFGCGC